MKKIKIILISIFMGFCTIIFAEEKTYEYESPIGVELRYNEDGTVKSILSSGEADFRIGDSKDIRQATQKATMRAKANIAKFLEEEISSSEVVEEITNTIISTDVASKETEGVRDSVEKMTETLSNKAKAMIRGVVTLKSEVKKEQKVVIVTVGIKQETIDAALKLGDQINKKITDKEKSNKKITEESVNSEIKKSKMYDDF